MKLWQDMTLDERQDRLGDPGVDRSRAREAYEDVLVDRFLRGLPLSIGDKQRARKLLKERGQ